MIMAGSAPTEGLCCTCNNSPSCFYRARRGPALFCELFDDFVSLALDAARGSASAAPAFAASPGSAGSALLPAGLCMNCEHSRNCTHLRPEGGTWHCEDYE
jgi:hypothetical protein